MLDLAYFLPLRVAASIEWYVLSRLFIGIRFW